MNGLFGSSGTIDVVVKSTSGRGLSADELADLAMGKILAVSDNAPPAIRDQAIAYRDRVRAVLVQYIAQAKRSAMTDAYNILRDHGQHDAAAVVQKLAQER